MADSSGMDTEHWECGNLNQSGIIGLPDAWLTEAPLHGHRTGVSGHSNLVGSPFDWDGGPFIVRIAAINEVGVQSELMVSVSKSSSWSSPPVSMIARRIRRFEIQKIGPTSEVMDIATNTQLEWDPLGFWTLPESGNMVEMGSLSSMGRTLFMAYQ